MTSNFESKATSGLCYPIISIMPPHDTYIETHLGSGSIMRNKPPALKNIAIDLNLKALRAFNCDYSVEKVHGCAHKFLKTYDFIGRELVYCDPPYLLYPSTSDEFDYKEQDHIELLELLKGIDCSVIVSGDPSTLYDKLLKDWKNLELQIMNQGYVRTEKLWFNYSLDRVKWHRHFGKDPVDRQRIKRKAESWARRYQEVPRGERLALLSAVMDVEAQEAD